MKDKTKDILLTIFGIPIFVVLMILLATALSPYIGGELATPVSVFVMLAAAVGMLQIFGGKN
jgi:hypothetical protein